jgi:hypothetical protein
MTKMINDRDLWSSPVVSMLFADPQNVSDTSPSPPLFQMFFYIFSSSQKTTELEKNFMYTTRKKHSCQNGLKLLPAQFFLPYEQDFPTEIAGKPVFLLLELENPAHMAGKIELEVI